MAGSRRKRRAPREMGLLEAAGRGAIAGLVGSAAMTLLDRAVAPRLGGRDRHVREWDKQVARGARRAGVRLAPAQRSVAGVATTLVYGAAIGAVYGVASTRLRGIQASGALLESGLAFAATLVAGQPPKPLKRPRGRAGLRSAVMVRGSGPAVFGRATTAAFRLLTR